MAKKTVPGSELLAKKIRERREELNMTVEKAAKRAGIGVRTWVRYESGAAIAAEKVRGVCRALDWTALPMDTVNLDDRAPTLDEMRECDGWSTWLKQEYGPGAATSFAIGSDILYDHIREDIACLSGMPKGTHLGQLSLSWLADDLPPQFLTQYDYDFLYRMKCELQLMQDKAKCNYPMRATNTMQEIIFFLCNEETKSCAEVCGWDISCEEIFHFLSYAERNPESDEKPLCADDDPLFDLDDWLYEFFDDVDAVMELYGSVYFPEESTYHFSHWFENAF